MTTSLRMMSRGYLDSESAVALQTRGLIGFDLQSQASASPGSFGGFAGSSAASSSGMSGGRWVQPVPTIANPRFVNNELWIDVKDIGLHMSVQTGSEMINADLFDEIALSIAEELKNMKRKRRKG